MDSAEKIASDFVRYIGSDDPEHIWEIERELATRIRNLLEGVSYNNIPDKIDMSPEEQKIAIAKIVGWELVWNWDEGAKRNILYLRNPAGRLWPEFTGAKPSFSMLDAVGYLPDYLNDLNLCHEFEKTLSDAEFSKYCDILCNMCIQDEDVDIEDLIRLSAEQRCKAFLQIKKLWK